MFKLEIGNSYSKITNLTPEQEKLLKKELSYVIGGSSAYFSGYGPKRSYLINKRGEFPTGLLKRVMKVLGVGLCTDKRKQPKQCMSLSLKTTLSPYKDQTLAVEAALKNHRGIIAMPTGVGKSLVIALIAARLNVKTLVIVPSLEIKKQLTLSLLEALGSKHKITVENIDSSVLKRYNDFNCLIIDEAHHSAAKTYRTLNKKYWNNIYYRFFLTATPYRNDSEESILFESIAGSIIYSISIKQAISKGYIVPIEAYYYDLPKQQTDAFTWSEVYSSLVVHNDLRNELIAVLLVRLNGNLIPSLCLVKEIAHGNIISELTGILFANGKDETSRQYIEQFNNGQIKCLIGTTGILGEGVDTKPAEFIIIAGLGKAKSAFLQQIGRGARNYPGKESCKVVLFKDSSHKFCLRHFKQQCKVLKEELGIVVTKLV